MSFPLDELKKAAKSLAFKEITKLLFNHLLDKHSKKLTKDDLVELIKTFAKKS